MKLIKTTNNHVLKEPEVCINSACYRYSASKCVSNNCGFTLIEMLIAISIAAVLASISMPSMTESIKNSKVKELSSEFTAALHLTQSESIKRGMQVSMKPHSAIANEWQTGWDIFVDENSNGTQEAGEELIQTYNIPPNALTLVSNNNTFGSWLAFQASGVSRGNGGTSGGFRICRDDADITKSRSITIQASGNIIVETGTVSCP